MKCIICKISKPEKEMYKVPHEIYDSKRKFPCCSNECYLKYIERWKNNFYKNKKEGKQ